MVKQLLCSRCLNDKKWPHKVVLQKRTIWDEESIAKKKPYRHVYGCPHCGKEYSDDGKSKQEMIEIDIQENKIKEEELEHDPDEED